MWGGEVGEDEEEFGGEVVDGCAGWWGWGGGSFYGEVGGGGGYWLPFSGASIVFLRGGVGIHSFGCVCVVAFERVLWDSFDGVAVLMPLRWFSWSYWLVVEDNCGCFLDNAESVAALLLYRRESGLGHFSLRVTTRSEMRFWRRITEASFMVKEVNAQI